MILLGNNDNLIVSKRLFCFKFNLLWYWLRVLAILILTKKNWCSMLLPNFSTKLNQAEKLPDWVCSIGFLVQEE